jgi:hypothetical protein
MNPPIATAGAFKLPTWQSCAGPAGPSVIGVAIVDLTGVTTTVLSSAKAVTDSEIDSTTDSVITSSLLISSSLGEIAGENP